MCVHVFVYKTLALHSEIFIQQLSFVHEYVVSVSSRVTQKVTKSADGCEIYELATEWSRDLLEIAVDNVNLGRRGSYI